MTKKPVLEHLKILIERSYNVAASIHLSWLYQSKNWELMNCSNRIFRSLGRLNYMRVWHDNSGVGNRASWFLKYIVVRDLQTMEKNHFISQEWFAVEKDDGVVRDFIILLLCFVWMTFWNIRSIVWFPLLAKNKNKNLLIYYRKTPIIQCPMVIYGFPFSLDHHRLYLLEHNVVHAVSSCSSCPCKSREYSLFLFDQNRLYLL